MVEDAPESVKPFAHPTINPAILRLILQTPDICAVNAQKTYSIHIY